MVAVSSVWLAVTLIAAATMVLKALGPVLLGGRQLPGPIGRVVDLLGPVVLAALIAVQTFASGEDLVVDARVPGVAAAAFCVWLRAPLLVTVVVAAAVTATIRALT
jgi:branched-subunit amino acid transport protein